MSTASKNKLLTWLVIVLLVANAATLVLFWLNKSQGPPQPKGSPKDFLLKELKLDTKQQEQLEVLMKEHREAAKGIRMKVKEAKDSLFALIKEPGITDSIKQAAAANASRYTEQLDVLTLNNFQKIRSLCNPDQQKKFDEIIKEVLGMMAQPGPRGPGMPPPPGGGPPPP